VSDQDRLEALSRRVATLETELRTTHLELSRRGEELARRTAKRLSFGIAAFVFVPAEAANRSRMPAGVPRYSPRSPHSASTRAFTSSVIAIGRPHSRGVSPGSLFVASMPIFEPSPGCGDAKSR